MRFPVKPEQRSKHCRDTVVNPLPKERNPLNPLQFENARCPMLTTLFGIIKFLIERLRNGRVEMILKLIFFNISFFIGFIVMQNILGLNIIAGLKEVIFNVFNISSKNIATILLWIIAQPVFLIYDYAMTLIITFYMEKIHGR